jgi:hypothetical protein
MKAERGSYQPVVRPKGILDSYNETSLSEQLAATGDIVTPGDALREESKIANTFSLSTGDHPGFAMKEAHSVVGGKAGTIVGRLCKLENAGVVEGVHFRQTAAGENTNALVVVGALGRVLFRNCIFERRHDAPAAVDPALPVVPSIRDCFVLVESGGRALFTGCVFRSELESGVMNGAGTVVQNLAPAAGGVFVGDGVNMTTHNHGTTVTPNGQEI